MGSLMVLEGAILNPTNEGAGHCANSPGMANQDRSPDVQTQFTPTQNPSTTELSPIETKLLSWGFESHGTLIVDGITWPANYWHDDSGMTVRLHIDGSFVLVCSDPCAQTLPMLAKVVDAMQELRECKDCGHLMRDKALDDFDRTRFDTDTWQTCDRCLAADSEDGIVAERDFYAAIGRGGRG